MIQPSVHLQSENRIRDPGGSQVKLLAATLVTVALAVPVLVITALREVFIAPRALAALIGY
jgi:hypothetical protein